MSRYDNTKARVRRDASRAFDRAWGRIANTNKQVRAMPGNARATKNRWKSNFVDYVAGKIDPQEATYNMLRPFTLVAEDVIRNALDDSIMKAEKNVALGFRNLEESLMDRAGSKLFDKQRRFLKKRGRNVDADRIAREAELSYG